MFPVRCWTCSKVIAHLRTDYTKLSRQFSESEALDKLGVRRPCCRRMFLSYVQEIDETRLKYETGTTIPGARKHWDETEQATRIIRLTRFEN